MYLSVAFYLQDIKKACKDFVLSLVKKEVYLFHVLHN